MTLLEECREYAKQNPLPDDIPKLTSRQIKRWINATKKADKSVLKDIRHFRAYVVLIYPENTEYAFAKEILTNKERSDSLRHYFPIFELNLNREE